MKKVKILNKTEMYVYDNEWISNIIQNQKHYDLLGTIVHLLSVNKNSVCVDVGSHIGYFTLLMAKKAKKVYAFEPEPKNFSLLKENIELNNLKNVILINKAVGLKNQKRWLYIDEKNKGHCSFNKISNKKVLVESIRLDDIIKENVDFMKIDVEGYEYEVLKSGENLIKKSDNLKMYFEFYGDMISQAGHNPIEFLNYIESLGFKFFYTKGSEIRPINRKLLIKNRHINYNLIAIKI